MAVEALISIDEYPRNSYSPDKVVRVLAEIHAGDPGVAQDYVEWGVPNIWVMDVRSRRMYVSREGELIEALGEVIAADARPIELTRSEIFWD